MDKNLRTKSKEELEIIAKEIYSLLSEKELLVHEGQTVLDFTSRLISWSNKVKKIEAEDLPLSLELMPKAR